MKLSEKLDLIHNTIKSIDLTLGIICLCLCLQTCISTCNNTDSNIAEIKTDVSAIEHGINGSAYRRKNIRELNENQVSIQKLQLEELRKLTGNKEPTE